MILQLILTIKREKYIDFNERSERFMKKLDFKVWTGVLVTVATGLAAFVNAVNEKRRTDKIDELIEKVEKL